MSRRGTSGHHRRQAARRVAIDILYQADVVGAQPTDVLEQWRMAGKSVTEYAGALVRGVQGDLEAIDGLLAAGSEGWAVHRMAIVDRTILRVACYEMRSGIPAAVAINEAILAAKELSTEDSGRFINGVLGKIAREMGEAP
jgi:N utilization substance protein B